MSLQGVTLVVVANQVVHEGTVKEAAIHILNGKIIEITTPEFIPAGAQVMRVDPDCIVLPGIVDSHVHVNEPGRTEWEGFDTATKTAAAGGVTTLADMPLNSIPPTTSVKHFQKT